MRKKRLLYGVTGEGLGHAMRADVVVRELENAGHAVKVVASGRAFDLLSKRFDALEIDGISLRYLRGGVARTRSFGRLLVRAPSSLRRNVEKARNEVRAFDPEACVSDFESFAHLYAKANGLPVVSLDHQHVITRCRHPRSIRRAVGKDFGVARLLVAAKMVGCDHYVVSSFFRPPVREPRTTLVGPIVRPRVTALRPSRGDHVLVYQTSEDSRVLRALSQVRADFRIYGTGRSDSEGRLRFREFHPDRFLDDLASARAVITHGGHTAISEALVLGKPVLSVPLARQGEQRLNAAYLESMGAGWRADRIDAGLVRSFLGWAETADPIPMDTGNEAVLQTLQAAL